MSKYPEDSRSVIDKAAERKAAEQKIVDAKKEEMIRRAAAMNGVFSTPNGRVFWKHLMDFCGIYAHDPVLNPAKLVEDRGKRSVILEAIRPYLEPETLKKLEK